MQLDSGPDEVASGVEGLHQLALQVLLVISLSVTGTAFTSSDLAAALSVTAYHVVALAKLRVYGEAAAELAKLGDLDDPQYLPNKGQGAGSLVPFALRWLQAELPGLAGQDQEGIQAQYRLLDWCRQQAATAKAAGDAAAAVQWLERQQRSACSLAGKHVRLRQHRAALAVLNEVLKQAPHQPVLWSQAGHVLLSLGDIPAAQRSFERAAAAAKHLGETPEPASSGYALEADRRSSLEGCRDRGLLLFAQQDFKGAIGEFNAALRQDPGDHVSANNLALCSMYAGSLSGGIQSLETSFMAAPERLMQEGVVLNLASMYDLGASGPSMEAKHRMATWVAATAPDDLDLACTKTALG
ncbi:hypothetical protein N2152v2_007209 [Parachlorella kessleri]